MDESFRGINGDGDCRASNGEERCVQLRGGAAEDAVGAAGAGQEGGRRKEERYLGGRGRSPEGSGPGLGSGSAAAASKGWLEGVRARPGAHSRRARRRRSSWAPRLVVGRPAATCFTGRGARGSRSGCGEGWKGIWRGRGKEVSGEGPSIQL